MSDHLQVVMEGMSMDDVARERIYGKKSTARYPCIQTYGHIHIYTSHTQRKYGNVDIYRNTQKLE